MKDQKLLMAEAAILYYEKNRTQQEIAADLGLSRQTVSKLLYEARRENIVEIKVRNPDDDRRELENTIVSTFGIKAARICPVSGKSISLRQLMTVRMCIEYLLPLIEKGNLNIAISWGHMVQQLISEFPGIVTENNTVYSIAGATDLDVSFYMSNEFARVFAEKIGADVRFAWFPYHPVSEEDCKLFRRTAYYNNMKKRWGNTDIAVLGIGGRDSLGLLYESFGYHIPEHMSMVGDIATHTYTRDGELLPMDSGTLCMSESDLRNAGEVVAVAAGDDKVEAIAGALRTGIVSTLITDEYTARGIISEHKRNG